MVEGSGVGTEPGSVGTGVTLGVALGTSICGLGVAVSAEPLGLTAAVGVGGEDHRRAQQAAQTSVMDLTRTIQRKKEKELAALQFVGGDSTTTQKPVIAKDKGVGRNDPCPCGSGKKWKKCGMINAPSHKA